MKTGTRRWFGFDTGEWRFAMAWMLGCGLCFAPFHDTQAAEDSPQTISIPLEYREAESDFITLGLSIDQQSKSFSKEPALSGRDLRRGTLSIGGTHGFGFIWDHARGQLALDLNRNGDLSDDPEGLFTCMEGARSGRYQQFDNVRMELPVHGVLQRLRFKLSLYDFSQLAGSIALHSYWSGKALLADGEWEFGIVPMAPGQGTPGNAETFLLRPWTAVGSGFSVGDGSLDTFTCGSNLFFHGQAYDVQRRVSAEAPIRFVLALTARETELGEVRFTGRHIRRALLTGDRWTVVLDEPDGVVAVPQDRYVRHAVHLQMGDAEAALERDWTTSDGIQKPMVAQPGAPGILNAGGPLTNTVTVQRRGQSLVLNYRLIGAGGEAYRPLSSVINEPPRFAVYQGDRLLESGDFEFG